MRTLNFFVFSSIATALALVSILTLSGCRNGLHDVMKEHGFTPISPPSTEWAVGSILEIKPHDEASPVLRATPKMANTSPVWIKRKVPDLKRNHDEKIALGVGVNIPTQWSIKIASKGAIQYSVVTSGNTISVMPIDPYAINNFPIMANAFGHRWGVGNSESPLSRGELHYPYEIWFVQNLEYRFYDSSGVDVTGAVIKELPLNASVEWSRSRNGSLVYSSKSSDDLLAIGYKARPIRASLDGPVPLNNASFEELITAQRDDSSVDLWDIE